MNRFRRSAAVLVIAATSVALSSGLATPRPAKAQQVGACVISGTASISPGLNVLPAAQSITFSGTMSPCAIVPTLSPGGAFGGSMSCPSGNIAACVPLGSASLTSSPVGSGNGIYTKAGCYVEIHIITPFGGIWIYWCETSNNGTSLPVTSVNFTGYMDMAQT